MSARTGSRNGVARKPVPRWLPARADELDEPRGRRGPQLVGDEPEGEGAGVRGLGVGGGGAVGGEELGAPGVGDVRGQLGVALGVGVATEERGDVGDLAGRAVEVGGGDRAVVGDHRDRDGVLERVAGLEPLAEVPAGVPEVPLVGERLGRPLDARRVPTGRRRARGVVDPRGHRRPLVDEDLPVAGRPVGHPGHVRRRRRPSPTIPRSAASGPAGGRRRGATPGTRLVTFPSGRWSAARSRSHFTEKPADVVQERAGLDVDLPVAGPSRALTGGAVGRDVARVVAEAPLGDPVDARRGARPSTRTPPRCSKSVCTTTAVTSSTVRVPS